MLVEEFVPACDVCDAGANVVAPNPETTCWAALVQPQGAPRLDRPAEGVHCAVAPERDYPAHPVPAFKPWFQPNGVAQARGGAITRSRRSLEPHERPFVIAQLPQRAAPAAPSQVQSAISDRQAAHGSGGLEHTLQRLISPRLVSLDELGYLPSRREEASPIFCLLVRRYERGKRIVRFTFVGHASQRFTVRASLAQPPR